MNVARFAVGLSFVSLTLVACGGGEAKPPPTTPAKPIATTPAVDPPLDLSPAPEPSQLLFVGRVTSPDNVLKAVGTWARLPLPKASDLARSSLPDVVADIIDFAAPIDVAATLSKSKNDPKPMIALSLAVTSLDEAKAMLSKKYTVTSGPNGQQRVEGIGDIFAGKRDKVRRHEDEDEDEPSCVLAPAVPKGARLVCGEDAAIEALLPYMTRTLPKERFPSDMHFEVRAAPVLEPLVQLRTMLPALARGLLKGSPALEALIDSAANEVVDLAGDLGRISIDARFADTGIEAQLRTDYVRSQSLVAQLAVSRPDRAGSAPPAFWHLPGDADIALFGRGADPKFWTHPRELLGNVLLEMADGAGMPLGEKNQLKDLIVDRMVPLFTGPGIYAKGYDATAVQKGVDALDKAREKRDQGRSGSGEGEAAVDAAEVALGEQVVGWHLYQTSEAIAKVGPALKDWVTVWNKPAFAKWLKGRNLDLIPKVRNAALPAGATLPKEAVHIEIVFPREDTLPVPPGQKGGKPKTVKRTPVVLHVLAVPDAGSTWLAMGLDAKLLAQKASASLASAPEKDTLGQAKGLDLIKNGKVLGAGFFTMRGFLVFGAFEGRGRHSVYSMLSALPDKGATPIVMTLGAEPAGPKASAGSSTGTILIPRAVIEDIVKLAMN